MELVFELAFEGLQLLPVGLSGCFQLRDANVLLGRGARGVLMRSLPLLMLRFVLSAASLFALQLVR